MTTHSDRVEPDRVTGESRFIVDAFLLDAVRLEGQAALDVVAADVSHDIAHTLNFLRCLVGGASDTIALSSEDASLAQKEVERLRRILSHLRRLKLSPPTREPVRVLALMRRAETEIADLMVERRISASLAITEGAVLLADPRLLYILGRDMLAAVVRRTEPHSTVEVRAALPEGLSSGIVEMRSSVSSATSSYEDDFFNPWAVTLEGTASLGLSVAYRIARALGWKLSTVSVARCIGLRLTIPLAAFSPEPAR